MRSEVLGRLRGTAASRDLLLTFGVLAASAAPLLLAPIRARFLGPEGRGQFAVFQADLVVCAAVGMLGTRLASYSLELDGRRRRDTALWPLTLTALLLHLSLTLPLAWLAHSSAGPVVAWSLVASTVLVPGWIVSQLELARAQVGGDKKWIFITTGGPPLVDFVLNVVAAVLRAITLASTIAITLFAELVRTLSACWRYTTRRRRESPEDGAGASRARGQGLALAREAVRLAPAAALPLIVTSVDVIILSFLVPPERIGVYAVAKLGLLLFMPVASALEGRLLGHAARLGVGRGMVRASTEVLPLAVVVGALGALVIEPLFGTSFQDAALPFVVACLAGVARIAFDCGAMLAARRGRSGTLVLAVTAMLGAEAITFVGVGVLAPSSVTAMAGCLLFTHLVGSVVIYLLMRKDVQSA